MHTSIRLLVSLLLQLPLLASRTSDVRPIDLLDQHRQAVVRVVAANAAGQPRVGCGVVVDDAGTIATAYELVRNASAARVELSDGTAFNQVTVLGTDGRIALLRIDAGGLRRVKLADSDKLVRIGTILIVLGGPGGAGRILAGGRVEATVHGKPAPGAQSPLLQYQMTTPLLATNWGGPVFTLQGEAVGIVTPRIAATPDTARHGLAPGNAIRDLLAEVGNARPEGKRLSPLPTSAAPAAHRSPKDVLAGARTIAVWAPFGPETLAPALVSGLGASLPWHVVPDPIEADLVLLVDAMEVTSYVSRVGQTTAVSGRQYEVTASLRDARTGDEVWSLRKGQSRDSSAAPFDQIAGRVVTEMQKSFQRLGPTAAGPKPDMAPSAPASARPAPVLLLEDLPAGFRVLPPEDLKKLGMDPDRLGALTGALGVGAQVAGHAEFIEPRSFQLVYALVLGPLSPLEAAKIHLDLSSPEAAIGALGTGSGGAVFGPPTVIPGFDVFGDRSLGFTAASTAGNPGFRMDLVIAIRDVAVEMVVSIYRNGLQPAVTTADIARALDARTAAAFK